MRRAVQFCLLFFPGIIEVIYIDTSCLPSVDSSKIDYTEIILEGTQRVGATWHKAGDIRIGLADNWLRHVKDVRNTHIDWLQTVPEGTARHNALCELNVLAQCRNVCETTVVQDAWQRGQEVVVHGWVYGLHNGLINDLRMNVATSDQVHAAFEGALARLQQRYTQDGSATPTESR